MNIPNYLPASSLERSIADIINFKENEVKLPKVNTLPKDYIFDEDKTVKWNREQVVAYNKQAIEAMECEQMLDEIFEKSMPECIFGYRDRVIYQPCFDKAWKLGGKDYVLVSKYFEELCDMVDDCFKAKEHMDETHGGHYDF